MWSDFVPLAGRRAVFEYSETLGEDSAAKRVLRVAAGTLENVQSVLFSRDQLPFRSIQSKGFRFDIPLYVRRAVRPEGKIYLGTADVFDSSMLTPKPDIRKAVDLAAERGIPVQIASSRGGNDGSVFITGGAVDIPLSWPGAHAHSFVEKIYRSDLDALTKLIKAIIEEWKYKRGTDPAEVIMLSRGPAVVLSLALCVAILDWAKSRELGMAKVVSFGNKADLDEVDFLRALGEDQETRVIAGYLVIDDYSRFILAWRLCTGMSADDVKQTLDDAIAFTGIGHPTVLHRPRLLSDNGPCFVSKALKQ